jgi:alpha-mannosidase/mannosylglycerate hydrolase
MLGHEYPASALELAWEYLLRNHPHDSICGCSTDETHAAMPYRFSQSRQIAEIHLQRAHEHLAADTLRGIVGPQDLGLSLFAPAGGSPQPCPEVLVRLPKDWPQFQDFFTFESKPSFRLEDVDGHEIPWQLLQVIPSTHHWRVPPGKMPWGESRQGVRLAIEDTLSPGQQKAFVLKRVPGPTRIPQTNSIGLTRDTLRNAFLELQALDNGTLRLTDLQTGKTFIGLLALEDSADVGDGWAHGTPPMDAIHLSTGGQTTFGLRENGPLLGRLHVRVEWLVPREFDFPNGRRSADLVPLVVEHLVTLRKGARIVEVETTVHNIARDHRLRMLCPTALSGTTSYWSDTPFDAVERPLGLRPNHHAMRELQVEMTPQQNWVAIGDGGHGLALLAPGQYESAVLDQPDRPLCVTLLRAFRKAVFTDGNDGGQIQGNHIFKLGLRPFSGAVPSVELFRAAQSLAAPVRSVFLDAQDLAEIPTQCRTGAVPRIEGDMVLSAQYRQRDHWVFRAFNPTDRPQPIKLVNGGAWTQTDFHGENPKAVSGICLAGPKKIVTLQTN